MERSHRSHSHTCDTNIAYFHLLCVFLILKMKVLKIISTVALPHTSIHLLQLLHCNNIPKNALCTLNSCTLATQLQVIKLHTCSDLTHALLSSEPPASERVKSFTLYMLIKCCLLLMILCANLPDESNLQVTVGNWRATIYYACYTQMCNYFGGIKKR